ncbi:MAG: lipoyl(octanoyl) transferase LipB [Proteobacteria bacterium]|nr:lipoyl(octanoyl) transferase LipB [Pseudomonadota bacterium]
MTHVAWRASGTPVPYAEAVASMEARVAAIREGREEEAVWLLEHPALYTAGTSARPQDLTDPSLFPVHRTGRGGQYTYHGPGQRIAYVMLDLRPRGRDLRAHVAGLETWLIDTLADFGLRAGTLRGRVGVWVDLGAAGGEAKIAAIGVRVRHWITYHGVSLNVSPDLSHYRGIVPCGIRDAGVTSLAALGIGATMAEFDAALKRNFAKTFGSSTLDMLTPQLDGAQRATG